MAVADAHKVASAIEAVVHQADAAYIGVVAIMQTLFNKGALNQTEIKDIADAMAGSIFAQSLAGMVPDYKTPRATPIAER